MTNVPDTAAPVNCNSAPSSLTSPRVRVAGPRRFTFKPRLSAEQSEARDALAALHSAVAKSGGIDAEWIPMPRTLTPPADLRCIGCGTLTGQKGDGPCLCVRASGSVA